MQRQWQTVAPPLNVSLAAWIGFKPKAAAIRVDAMSDGEFAAELAELGRFFDGLE